MSFLSISYFFLLWFIVNKSFDWLCVSCISCVPFHVKKKLCHVFVVVIRILSRVVLTLESIMFSEEKISNEIQCCFGRYGISMSNFMQRRSKKKLKRSIKNENHKLATTMKPNLFLYQINLFRPHTCICTYISFPWHSMVVNSFKRHTANSKLI